MFRAVISRSRRFTNHCLLATAAPIPSIGLTGADPPCGTSGGQPQPVFRHCSPRQSRSISSFPDLFPERLCVENKNGLRWFGSVANGDKRVLYKGKWMVPIYVMVRLKVFQLTAFGSLAVPLNAWMATVSQTLYRMTVFSSISSLHLPPHWFSPQSSSRKEIQKSTSGSKPSVIFLLGCGWAFAKMGLVTGSGGADRVGRDLRDCGGIWSGQHRSVVLLEEIRWRNCADRRAAGCAHQCDGLLGE